MNNWLRNTFKRDDTLRKMTRASEKNIVHNFIESLSGMGCRVQKSRDGREAIIIIDGYSDMPYPPNIIPPWDRSCPFLVTMRMETASPTDKCWLKVGQGYIFIGQSGFQHPAPISGLATNGAEYDWPARDGDGVSTDTDEIDVSAKDDGIHLLYMQTPIDPDSGTFTASYKPEIDMCVEADWDLRALDIIIARVTIKDGIAINVRQDLTQNIRAMSYARMKMDTGSDTFNDEYQLVNMSFAPTARTLLETVSVDEAGTATHTVVSDIVYAKVTPGGGVSGEIQGGVTI